MRRYYFDVMTVRKARWDTQKRWAFAHFFFPEQFVACWFAIDLQALRRSGELFGFICINRKDSHWHGL